MIFICEAGQSARLPLLRRMMTKFTKQRLFSKENLSYGLYTAPV